MRCNAKHKLLQMSRNKQELLLETCSENIYCEELNVKESVIIYIIHKMHLMHGDITV